MQVLCVISNIQRRAHSRGRVLCCLTRRNVLRLQAARSIAAAKVHTEAVQHFRRRRWQHIGLGELVTHALRGHVKHYFRAHTLV